MRAALSVMAPVLAMMIPPEPLKVAINSTPILRAVVVLYCNLAAAPYVGAAVAVAVPSIDKIPLTVTPVVVLALVFDKVRFV